MAHYRFRPTLTVALAALLAAAPLVTMPMHGALAQAFGVTITEAPPPLPVYDQPPLPDVGYIWTPGYWDYGPFGYYWVPGTWVLPPEAGLLWTPGWWGWNNGVYAFNRGYWGDQVGYYGGIDYGFGYGGEGYGGGYWQNGAFFYNRNVNRFGNVRITNVYERPVVVNQGNRFSFNGPNGVAVRPSHEQEVFMHARHVDATPLQMQHVHLAQQNPVLRASMNHGRPTILATPRPAAFRGPGVVGVGHAPGPHPIAVAPRPVVGHPVAPGPRPVEPGNGVMHHGPVMAQPPHVAAPYHPAPRPAPEGGMAPRPGGYEPRQAAPRPMAPQGMAPRPMAPQGMARPPMPAPHPAAPPHPAGPEKHPG